jgi:hypothetical protein
MKEKKSKKKNEAIITVKDLLEYYAKKGLNPYLFSTYFKQQIFKDKDLAIIFEKENSELFNKLLQAVDVAIQNTFENQDIIDDKCTFKHLKGSLKLGADSFRKGANKGRITKENKDQRMNWHIYKTSEDETLGQYKDRWEFVHYMLKYKLLYPAIWLARKLIGKKLKLKIPNVPYNENLLLFDAAFEDAIRDWNQLYLRGLPNPETAGKSDEWWDLRIKNWNTNTNLRMAKEAILAIALTDTAYREFLNLLIHNIGRHGAAHYKRVREAGNGKIRHVFYSSGFAEDVHYYQYYRTIRDKTKSRMIEVGTVEITDKPDEDEITPHKEEKT